MDDAGIPSVDGEGDESSLPSVDGGDDASIPSMGGEGDASVDFPFDECSLPSVDGGDDASIPSMDGESDGPDLEGLPPLDASPSPAGQEAYASEVAGWGLLGMFLGSPAPSCVPPSKSGRTRKSANLWDDRAVADDLDGVLPDRREGAALSSGGARHRSDPSLMPSLSGISDDDSAEDDSLPPRWTMPASTRTDRPPSRSARPPTTSWRGGRSSPYSARRRRVPSGAGRPPGVGPGRAFGRSATCRSPRNSDGGGIG
ncbi:hypothetical protein THAOC_13432 [Thalassiosira oceanica]|uniref:Uncharacterized protein n=1 Tax=Thalassiosira oceanica TaxID=159749 RepID=K0SK86_THAOC|nr:hypothetical protein THAOC_13432 [Thalassiosira oceanica]|eukprot:EJK65685.1 hypothetical protein THAOC_13432 [Thalassiosira oceanica]